MFRNFKPIFLILMGVSVDQIIKTNALQEKQGSKTYSLQHLKKLSESKVALRALTRGQDTSIDTLNDQTNNKQSEDFHVVLNGLELLCKDASLSTLTAQTNTMSGDVNTILRRLELLCQAVDRINHNKTDGHDGQSGNHFPTSCLDALKNGQTTSGVYIVQPEYQDSVEVNICSKFCTTQQTRKKM